MQFVNSLSSQLKPHQKLAAPYIFFIVGILCFILLLLLFSKPGGGGKAGFGEDSDGEDQHHGLNVVQQQQHESSSTSSKRQQPSRHQRRSSSNNNNNQEPNDNNNGHKIDYVPDPPPAVPGDLRYRPQKRYEPTPFERGEDLNGRTPLRLIKDGLAQNPPLPDNWDGGYGWIFVKYIPSDFETRWYEAAKPLDGLPGNPLCNLLRTKFKKEHEAYMSQKSRFPANNGGTTQCDLTAKLNASIESGKDFTYQNLFDSEPLEFDHLIFSRFEYVYKCTQPPCRTKPSKNGPKIGSLKYTYIEPLVGLLRYPDSCFDGRYYESLINKNYMIIDPWSLINPSRSTISPDPKIFFFDGGASVWDAGTGGASQSWFYRVYDAICIRFQNFFMWEVAGHDPKRVFQLLPGPLRPGYRWFNVPLSIDTNSWDNPMNHLLAEAKKEDVVIFKIDFDTPHLELGLIQAILDYPQISDLVDELYFEHHVNQELLRNHWGTGGMNVYHTDSIKLFAAMRMKGVRAHSWV